MSTGKYRIISQSILKIEEMTNLLIAHKRLGQVSDHLAGVKNMIASAVSQPALTGRDAIVAKHPDDVSLLRLRIFFHNICMLTKISSRLLSQAVYVLLLQKAGKVDSKIQLPQIFSPEHSKHSYLALVLILHWSRILLSDLFCHLEVVQLNSEPPHLLRDSP